MTTDETRTIARRFFGAWRWEFEVVDELAHPAITVAYPLMPRVVVGADAYKRALQKIHADFPDFAFVGEEPIADGDRAVVVWRGGGTHTGTLLGVPATGKIVRFSGISVYRVRDGKVVEERGEEDTMSILQQVGALGLTAEAPAEN